MLRPRILRHADGWRWRRHSSGGSGRHRRVDAVQLAEALGQVGQQSASDRRVDRGRVGHEHGDLVGTLGEPGPEAADVTDVGPRTHGALLAQEQAKVLNGHFQNVRFLQLGRLDTILFGRLQNKIS